MSMMDLYETREILRAIAHQGRIIIRTQGDDGQALGAVRWTHGGAGVGPILELPPATLKGLLGAGWLRKVGNRYQTTAVCKRALGRYDS